MSLLGESPLDKRKLQTLKSYILEKKKKFKKLVNRKLDLLPPNSDAIAIDTSEDDEYKATKKKLSNACADDIVKVLQDKYKSTQSNCEKIIILTIYVAQWSNRKVRREFNCSHRLESQAKEVLITKGVLSTPNSKKEKSLPAHVKDKVKEFYYSDTVSHVMPGKKDFLSVMENEETKHIQKRLVLNNLKEVFQLFSEKYPKNRVFVVCRATSKRMSLQEQAVLTVYVYVPFIKMLSS